VGCLPPVGAAARTAAPLCLGHQSSQGMAKAVTIPTNMGETHVNPRPLLPIPGNPRKRGAGRVSPRIAVTYTRPLQPLPLSIPSPITSNTLCRSTRGDRERTGRLRTGQSPIQQTSDFPRPMNDAHDPHAVTAHAIQHQIAADRDTARTRADLGSRTTAFRKIGQPVDAALQASTKRNAAAGSWQLCSLHTRHCIHGFSRGIGRQRQPDGLVRSAP
jgi:hypothetical protein